MQIRHVASNPDILIPQPMQSASSGPLQHLINTVKAVWNAIVRVIQSIFSCCVNTDEGEFSTEESSEGECETVSSSEEEDSDSDGIRTQRPIPQKVESAGDKQRLMFAYRDWLSSSDFSPKTPQCLENLNLVISSLTSHLSVFAIITKAFLESFPAEYNFFRLTILTPDHHGRLKDSLAIAYNTCNEDSLAIAYNTCNIDPLKDALLS